MSWDFSTEPEFQEQLEWIAKFVKTEIEPLDLAFNSHLVYDKSHPVHDKVVRPLQDQAYAGSSAAFATGSSGASATVTQLTTRFPNY